MTVSPIPDGYNTVTPYVIVPDIRATIAFTRDVFGAVEHELIELPGGEIAHAEIRIGDSVVMLGQARDQWKPIPSSLYVYVEDVDAVYERALAQGAQTIYPPTDQFYGDRSAGVSDRQGNFWWVATHIEDVDPEEMRRRAAEHRST